MRQRPVAMIIFRSMARKIVRIIVNSKANRMTSKIATLSHPVDDLGQLMVSGVLLLRCKIPVITHD